MKKMVFIFSILCLSIFLFSCSKGSYEPGNGYAPEIGNTFVDQSIMDRKMIYDVKMTFTVNDMNEILSFIRAQMNQDEWFDQETIQKNYSYLHLRIKTDRLDDFIRLFDHYQIDSFEKTGLDISLSYQDKSDKIISLESQRARLVELYEQASLSEMIVINKQISDIDVELARLKGELIKFDSLVEYSNIYISIHQTKIVTKLPFLNRLLDSLLLGVEGIIKFFENVLIAIAFLLPIVLTLGPIGYGFFKGIKWYNKRQKSKKIQKIN